MNAFNSYRLIRNEVQYLIRQDNETYFKNLLQKKADNELESHKYSGK